MKFKKSKHFKKQVSFYCLNYGYHEPALLLVDGPFLKAAVEKQMNIVNQFTKYARMKCVPKVTQCVLRELNSLRSHLPGVYSAAKKLQVVKCGHIQGVPAHECLYDLVEKPPRKDPNHPNQYYWVLTQDENLKEKLATLDHVPICYLMNNVIVLMEPYQYLQRKLRMENYNKFMPGNHEYNVIDPVKKEMKEQLREKRLQQLRKLRSEMQVKAKKPAQGPNPLSIRKKKKQIDPVTKKIRKRRHKMKHRKHKQKSNDDNHQLQLQQ